jgi:hypothetical protein
VHDAAAGVTGFKRGERRGDFADAARDFGLWRYVNVVFGEVYTGFKKGDKFDERLFYWLNAMAERAAHLTRSLAGLGEGLGLDKIANGFCLGEVEFAGQKCALRELAGLCESRAEVKRAAQQKIQNNR